MRLFGGIVGFLLTAFLFLAFLAGLFVQLNSDFGVGTVVVLLVLGIELAREISDTEKKKKIHWGQVIGLGFGALLSMGALFICLIASVVLKDRTSYILLMDSSLSTLVFLSSSFLRFWRHLSR